MKERKKERKKGKKKERKKENLDTDTQITKMSRNL